MTYWALSRPARWQLWATGAYWALCDLALHASESPTNPALGGPLLTWQNVLTIAGGLIAVGTLWQQWKDARQKIDAVATALTDLRNDHLPRTYVRQDIFEQMEERMRLIEQRRGR